jgi:hypothetical protein
VLSAMYPSSPHDAIELAGLDMQLAFGDHDPSKHKHELVYAWLRCMFFFTPDLKRLTKARKFESALSLCPLLAQTMSLLLYKH